MVALEDDAEEEEGRYQVGGTEQVKLSGITLFRLRAEYIRPFARGKEGA